MIWHVYNYIFNTIPTRFLKHPQPNGATQFLVYPMVVGSHGIHILVLNISSLRYNPHINWVGWNHPIIPSSVQPLRSIQQKPRYDPFDAPEYVSDEMGGGGFGPWPRGRWQLGWMSCWTSKWSDGCGLCYFTLWLIGDELGGYKPTDPNLWS